MTERITFQAKAPELEPVQAYGTSAGFDLSSNSPELWIDPGEHELIHTGVRFNIPDGYVGVVTPRSSLGIKLHTQQSNGVGLIDAGFTGEVLVSLVNLGRSPVRIAPLQKICQIMFLKLPDVSLAPGDVEHAITARGSRGIGSSDNYKKEN